MVVGAWLMAAALRPEAAGAGVSCPGTDNSPATPVPECVAADGTSVSCATGGAIRMWSDIFQPAPTIPAERDTTDRVGGQTVPGAQSGHELFKSVDIVTVGNVNRLYVAYNAGIQAWNIQGNPTNPSRLSFRDGWMGHFLSFPPVSEQLAFIEDIAGINVNSTTDLVAASGKDPVGPTIWTFSTTSNSFTQKYQDVGTETRQVKFVQVASGTIYLIAATDDGVAVYNATAAQNLSTPCLDDQGSACSSVYRGLIPGIQLGAYADAIVNPANNRVYVVTSDGNFVDVEIYELADPNNPAGAVRRLSAPSLVDGRGPALFNYDGHFYMALELDDRLRIYIIDDCVDGTGCFIGAGSAEAAVNPIVLRNNPANTEYVTYSKGSGGKPFLYYGVSVGNLDGSDIDQLFDVSALRPPGAGLPTMTQVTDGGGFYNDPCSGDVIRYWSHYYPRNTHGLRSFIPRRGKVSGKDFFYRAANSILDIHVYDGGSTGNPAIDVAILNPQSEYWMGDQVTFQATGSSGCTPNGTWIWDATTPGNVTANLVADNGSQRTYTFTCDLAGRCPDSGITMSATNTATSCNNAEVDTAMLTVKDPDVGITAIDSGGSTTFVECQDVPFSATLAGRGPAFWEWRIGGETQCPGSNQSTVDLTSTTPQCDWPASQGNPPDPNLIFADGFESGDTSRWSAVGSTESPGAPTPGKAQGTAEGTGTQVTAELVLWDEFTSSTNPVDNAQMMVTVDSGDPAFNGAVNESVNGFTATLTAAASFTTDWSWEFEDPQGGQTCTFGQDTVSCATEQTTVNSAAHTWTAPGTYRYNVTISNCATAATATMSGDVTLEDQGVQPNILSFNFNDGTPAACCGSPQAGFKCSRSTNIEFAVEMAESESYVFRFDWERNSSAATPNYSVQSPSGSGTSPGGNPEWHFLKSFTASGCVYPMSKVNNGALSDEKAFFWTSIELVNGTPNCSVSQNCD